MSDISSVIAELRRLKEIKDENKACLDRHEEIENEIEAKSSDIYGELASGLNDLKETQSEKLDKFMPKTAYPYEKSIPDCEVEKINIIYPISGLVFYASIILFLLTAWFDIEVGGLITFLCIVGIFVGGGIWIFNNSKISNYYEWKKERKKWLANASKNETNKEELFNAIKIFDDAFFAEMELFEKEEDNAAEKCVLYKDEITKSYQDELDIIYDKLGKCVDELSSSEILHQDCVPYLEEILKNLETGRADSLKEAINIALEDERKNYEEANRREEARRQESILQEQAYQNRMHNLEMERKADQQAAAARQHAAVMEKQAAMQIRETEKLREEIKRQNNKR